MSLLEKYFELEKNKTNVQTEITAVVTTFLTMAYIIVLNPIVILEGLILNRYRIYTSPHIPGCNS